jgi:hypothetical protein
MIEVDVTGGSKLQRGHVVRAAKFYMTLLLGDTGSKNVLLTVRLKPDLYKKYSSKADCIPLDSDEDYSEYEIRVDSTMRLPAVLRCLAHEAVHVSQYEKGHLKDSSRAAFEVIWKRKKFDIRTTNYYDLPWEIEAYGHEVGLFERYVSSRRLSAKSWYKDYDFA